MAIAGLAGASSLDAGAANGRDCFREIERGRGLEVVCEYPTRLSEAEQQELRRITRNLVIDARCVVSIRIDRSWLEQALATGEGIIEAPPQPVRCEIETPDRAVPVAATFAPRVTFEAGRAVAAAPGLDNIEGVPQLLAWPVIQYVNRAPTIERGIVDAINAYRAHLAVARSARAR